MAKAVEVEVVMAITMMKVNGRGAAVVTVGVNILYHCLLNIPHEINGSNLVRCLIFI